MTIRKSFHFALLILSFTFAPLFATTSTWTGDTDNDWNTADNWDNGVPNAVDDIAVFTETAIANLSGAANTNVAQINITNGSDVTVGQAAAETLIFNPLVGKKRRNQGSVFGGGITVAAFDIAAETAARIKTLRGSTTTLTSTGGAGANSSLTLLSQGKNSGGNVATYLLDLTGFAAPVTVGNRVSANFNGSALSGNLSILKGGFASFTGAGGTATADFSIAKNGTVQIWDGTAALTIGTSNANTFSNKGTFETVDLAGLTFNSVVTNSRAMTIGSLDGADPIAFKQAVTNGGTLTFTGGATTFNVTNGVLTNNKKKTVTSTGDATVTFGPVTNRGNFNSFESSTNTFGAQLDNYGTMRFAGTSGQTSCTNDFNAAVNNYGNMYFYGLDGVGGAGTGGSDNSFDAELTNEKGNLHFFEDSVNTFNDLVRNRSKINFYGNSVNTFNDGFFTISPVNFYGNSQVTLAGGTSFSNIESASATYNFYENTLVTLNGASFINYSNNGINFYGNSQLTLNNNSVVYFGGMAFYGNSQLTLNNSSYLYNENTGSFNFYGNSKVTLNATSYLGSDGATGSINIYGNATVTYNSTANSNTQSSINIYEDGVLDFTAAGDISAAPITVGHANKKLRGGILKSTGAAATVNTLNIVNGGTLNPAMDQVFTITGNYTQEEGTTLLIPLNVNDAGPGTVTTLTVTGDARLAGSVLLKMETGFITGAFTILTVAPGQNVAGDFTTKALSPDSAGATLTSIVTTQGTNGTVVANVIATLALPEELSNLKGNNKKVAKNLKRSAPKIKKSKDAIKVANSLARQSAKKFTKDLKRLTPATHLALNKKAIKNARLLANDFDRSFQIEKENKKENPSGASLMSSQRSFFVNSIDTVEDVVGIQKSPLAAKTYGANCGWNTLYQGKFFLENGFGVTQSEIRSSEDLGSLSSDSAYFAPTFAVLGNNSYASAMLVTGVSNHHQTREIHFADIHRKAESNYQSIELLAQTSAGYTLGVNENTSLQADAALTAQMTHNRSYQERGAKSLNLFVKSQTSQIVQPSLKLTASKEMFVGHAAITASVYAHGSSDIEVKASKSEAKFGFSDEFFVTALPTESATKMLVGADLSLKRSKNFICSANFEIDALKGLKDSSAYLKMGWLF